MTIPNAVRDSDNVLVASSDDKLRSRLITTIDGQDRVRVVAEAADGASVLSHVGAVDAVVLDIALGGQGVLAVMEELLHRAPPPVIVIVSRTDAPYLRDAMEAAGASDYLIVPREIEVLAERIRILTASRWTADRGLEVAPEL